MANLRASAKQDGVNVKDQTTGTIFTTLKTGWEVDGDMSIAQTDLINIIVYRKGAGMPDIPLSKPCKCSLSGLNTPVAIVAPPPPDPDPDPEPPPVNYDNIAHFRHWTNGVIDRDEWYQHIEEIP
jgi:hypothetical protein